MSRPYERTERHQVAPGGHRTVWEIGFPSKCLLTKLVVKQVGGVLVPFRVDLFNKRIAAVASTSSGGADPDGDYTGDPDNYRVCDTIDSDSAGKLIKFFDGSEGSYENKDGDNSAERKYKIYVEIEPEGADDKTFDVTLGCLMVGMR